MPKDLPGDQEGLDELILSCLWGPIIDYTLKDKLRLKQIRYPESSPYYRA